MKLTTSLVGRALLLMVTSSIATMHAVAEEQETSAATNTRMIQLIGTLESEPFQKDHNEVRSEVMTWLVEAPDVTVRICLKVLGDIEKIKGYEGGILVVQLGFSQAKFILENPDKATDQHAINVAGVEGVLRTYAAMKSTKTELAIPEVDRLVKLQESGELGAAVVERQAKCGASEETTGKAACRAKGGTIRKVCRLQQPACVVPYSDGGKRCTDNSQCKGKCILDIDHAPAPDEIVVGRCLRDDDPCGCRVEVVAGKVAGGGCYD